MNNKFECKICGRGVFSAVSCRRLGGVVHQSCCMECEYFQPLLLSCTYLYKNKDVLEELARTDEKKKVARMLAEFKRSIADECT